MDPWEAVEPPHEAAWASGAGQGGAAEPAEGEAAAALGTGQEPVAALNGFVGPAIAPAA